jgi:hypothetical protein
MTGLLPILCSLLCLESSFSLFSHSDYYSSPPPRKETSDSHWIGCWVGPRTGLGAENRKISDSAARPAHTTPSVVDVTTDGQSASLSWCRTPLWGPRPSFYFFIFFVGQLLGSWCGVPSLTRRRVCSLHLLLGLASTVILGSESRGTQDHILLCQVWDSPNLERQVPSIFIPQEQGVPVIPPGTGFPFSRLLRLAGLRWRYSNPGIHRLNWAVLLHCCMTLYQLVRDNEHAVAQVRRMYDK